MPQIERAIATIAKRAILISFDMKFLYFRLGDKKISVHFARGLDK
jgi:hypothetical protein